MGWMTDIIVMVALCSISALLGSIVGAFAGLVPGLHPNTLAVLFSGIPPVAILWTTAANSLELAPGSAPLLLGCFLIGLLMSHSLTEVIPTAMLGIVDDETVVSQLPSQRLYNMGRSDLVVESVIVGGLGAVLLFAIILIPTGVLMGAPVQLYSAMKPLMGLLLLGIACNVLVRGRDKARIAKSLMIFFLSGSIGIALLTLQIPVHLTHIVFPGIWAVDSSSFLLPAFSGMFALPSLAFSVGKGRKNAVRTISCERVEVLRVRPLLSSILPSVMVGWLPGITNAYATTFSLRRGRDISSIARSASSYLVTYSATNVGGSLQSILAMGTILRFRNGTLEAVGSNFPGDALMWHDVLNPPVSMLAFLWAACISIVLGAWLCRFLGSRTLSRGSRNEPRLMRYSVLLLLVSLSFILAGPIGLLVLASCFLVGTWAIRIGAPRIHLMGVLLVPVIVFFMAQ